MTLTECYTKSGVTVRAPGRTWSALRDDGAGVVITLWSDFFQDTDRRHYVDRVLKRADSWENKRRIEHLRYARDHCGGVFQSIIVSKKDASRTSTATREPGPRMRVMYLNDRTGEFHA